MSHPIAHYTYTGAALPAGTDVEVLYDSSLDKVSPSISGGHRFIINVKHSQAGTIKGYWSLPGPVTWVQFYTSGSIAAPGAGAITTIDKVIEGFHHIKFDWTNGGTVQATFDISMAMITERSGV
jgi:hypothetical protein